MTRQPPLEAGGCLRSQAGSIGLCLRTHPAQVSAASSMEWMWRPVWRASPGRQQALVLCGLEEALPMAGGSHKAFWAMWSGCSFGPSHLQFQSSHLRLSNSPPDPLYVHRLAQVGRRGTREVGRRECVRDSVPPPGLCPPLRTRWNFSRARSERECPQQSAPACPAQAACSSAQPMSSFP